MRTFGKHPGSEEKSPRGDHVMRAKTRKHPTVKESRIQFEFGIAPHVLRRRDAEWEARTGEQSLVRSW